MSEDATPTVEELQAELSKVRTELAASQNETTTLRNEAAGHRVKGGQAMRQLHATKKVLQAHNISFDVDTADVGGLTIADGKVEGEFSYTPPAPTDKTPKPADGDGTGGTVPLTLEEVKGMDEETINKRWDEIAPLLTGS